MVYFSFYLKLTVSSFPKLGHSQTKHIRLHIFQFNKITMNITPKTSFGLVIILINNNWKSRLFFFPVLPHRLFNKTVSWRSPILMSNSNRGPSSPPLFMPIWYASSTILPLLQFFWNALRSRKQILSPRVHASIRSGTSRTTYVPPLVFSVLLLPF